jgi:hypothetical protein
MRRARGLEPAQLVQPQASLLAHDRRNGYLQIARDADRAPAPAAPALHLPAAHPTESPRRVMGTRGAIGQAVRIRRGCPLHPFRNGLA